MQMSRKKAGLILFGLAMMAITGFAALSQQWVTSTIAMRLVQSSAGYGPIKAYWDCDMLHDVVDIDWGSVTSGQRYVRSIFIVNKGNTLLYICYMPTYFNDTQYKFHIECFVHAEGTPCQLNKIIPPPPIPEKEDILANPTLGYKLYPGMMIKIDIYLTVEMIEIGKAYVIPFEIHGYAP